MRGTKAGLGLANVCSGVSFARFSRVLLLWRTMRNDFNNRLLWSFAGLTLTW